MPNIGARVSEDLYERITAFTAEDDERTQSDAIRELLERGLKNNEHERELKERIDELETERDNLRRQLQATNRRVDEHQELQEFVAEQREITHRRERDEHRLRHAGVITRAKWWIWGMPSEEQEN